MTDALKDALQRIAAAATDALAAMPGDDEPIPATEPHDYVADEIRLIEARAEADVRVLEAQAAGAVAVAEAVTPDDPAPPAAVLDAVTGADDGDGVPDVIDGAGLVDPDAGEPITDPADVLDAAANTDAAADVLDALPVIDPVELVDNRPASTHWYTKPLFGRK